MIIASIVKDIQNIMHQDASANDDTQRISQFVWAIFLDSINSLTAQPQNTFGGAKK